MAKNSEQHYQELLITLEYLLNCTDENNPATTIAICEYAKEHYGLKFDKTTLKGNDIDRRRIGKILKYLFDLCDNNPDSLPFILETTNGGKYYIDKKNGLNEDQTARIIAAIKNDKYTKESDVDDLSKHILEAFGTSEYNKTLIKNRSNALLKGVKKLDKETIRKISLIEQAYRDKQYILVNINNKNDWFVVHLIKEYGNKLYVFLVPYKKDIMPENKSFIFDTVDKIDIPHGTTSLLLREPLFDATTEELFGSFNPDLVDRYGSLDGMMKEKIKPVGGETLFVSFYFNLKNEDLLRKSYEVFFGETFRYQKTNLIGGMDEYIEELSPGVENWNIVTLDEPKEPKYGLVSNSYDLDAFLSWILSDPYSTARTFVYELITIIKPNTIKRYIAKTLYVKLLSKINYLTEKEQDNLFNLLMASHSWSKKKGTKVKT